MASVSLQQFPQFYRTYGVRSLSDLASPKPRVLRFLPRNALLHSLDGEGGMFPDGSNFFIQNSPKKVLLLNVQEMGSDAHFLRRLTVPITRQVAEFIQKNRKFLRFNGKLEDAKDELQTVVNNYNPLLSLYVYNQSNLLNSFWKWYDPYATIWETIARQSEKTTRQHFLFVKVPKEIPARSRLTTYASGNVPAMLRHFQTPDEFFILDIWRFLNPATREVSAISKIKEDSTFSRVNFVFQLEDGRCNVLNLGFLKSFVEGEPNLTDRKMVNQRKPLQVGTLFLMYLMRLQVMGQSPDEPIEDEESFDSGPDLSSGITADQTDPGMFSSAALKTDLKNRLKKLEKSEEVLEDTATVDDELQKAEEDLQALEVLAKKRESIRGKLPIDDDRYDPTEGPDEKEVIDQVFSAKSPQERLEKQLEDASATGEMTAIDYRRLLKNVQKVKDMPDPYGSNKTIAEAATVTAEDIRLDPEDTRLVGDERILDPSMMSSAVEAFDRQYINKVMRKDILSVILGIQNSGVTITNIETEQHTSIAGGFEIYSVTVKPIRGESSTIRMRVPLVAPDGTFENNNVRYSMRRQRVD